jgi:HAD superfamily hydrolase (TIGR01509 family)
MPVLMAFDFDGVVVNSIQPLRNVYKDFLSEFGITGTETEFQSLNGPAITDIVAYLKEKYEISEGYSNLLKNYKARLKKAYKEVPLVDHALSTLQNLMDRGVDLALVTSSIRTEVDVCLCKYGLERTFKHIVTGDDVKNAKPSPDLYLDIIDKFPDHMIWAIEDSENGIKAAKDAGLNVIFFDQFFSGTKTKIDCRISSLNELELFVDALDKGYTVVECVSKICVQLKDGYFPDLTKRQDLEVTRIWEKNFNSKDLHDGQILYYLSHSSSSECVTVDAFWGPYRYFYSRLEQNQIGMNFAPLAVSGICKSKEGLVLIAKRKNVTELGARLELVPSGGISDSFQDGVSVDFKRQLLLEFVEETSLKEDSISSISEMGIVKDMKNNVFDLCCLLDFRYSSNVTTIFSDEYSCFSWVDFADLTGIELIPTSLGALYLHKKSVALNV